MLPARVNSSFTSGREVKSFVNVSEIQGHGKRHNGVVEEEKTITVPGPSMMSRLWLLYLAMKPTWKPRKSSTAYRAPARVLGALWFPHSNNPVLYNHSMFSQRKVLFRATVSCSSSPTLPPPSRHPLCKCSKYASTEHLEAMWS